MRQGSIRRHCAARFVALLILVILPLISCGGGQDRFALGLARADQFASAGESKKALKTLAGLRKRAVSVSQWLSVAKRERKLDQAHTVDTLNLALKKYPSNLMLSAVLADSCADAGDFGTAVKLAPVLVGTPYGIISSWADIMRTKSAVLPDLDPAVWLSAYEGTGIPSCLGNAAVLYAMRGKMIDALASADRRFALDRRGHMPALIAYDSGHTEMVFSYLGTNEQELNSDEIALLADTEWASGDAARARDVWTAWAARFPGHSAVPLFDLAVTEREWSAEKVGLEFCISGFPVYYPAVCRYVRSVAFGRPGITGIEKDLHDAGFSTLAMDEAALQEPVDPKKAVAILDIALKSSEDIRFKIEKLRFTQMTAPDEVRTAGAMWKLLEKYPDDSALVSYAQWYFTSIRHFDAAFSVRRREGDPDGAFYRGLQASLSGELDRADKEFALVAGNAANSWCALANIARIKERQGDLPGSAGDFASAAALAPDDKTKSILFRESAGILGKLEDRRKAMQTLGYAIELDPGNYEARAMLRRLEGE